MTWLDFVLQLIGTLLGTGVGFGLAMWWDRKKKSDDEADRRLKTIKAIHRELKGVGERLMLPEADFANAPDNPEGVEVEMTVPFLSSAAFEVAVHSGNLALLAPGQQVELSTCYEHLRILRLLSDNVVTSHSKTLSVQDEVTYLQNSYAHIRGHSEMLIGEIDSALNALEENPEECKSGS